MTADLRERVRAFLATHDPAGMDRLDFLRARFDAGLAWVSFPEGLGGLSAPRALQPVVDAEFAAAGAPDNDPLRIGIGLGMAAPTILRHGTDEQRRRWLRPLWPATTAAHPARPALPDSAPRPGRRRTGPAGSPAGPSGPGRVRPGTR